MFNRSAYMPSREDIDIDINMEQNVSQNVDVMMNSGSCNQMPAMNNPVMEPMQQRVVHRNIVHEVPHVCPVNTKVINHHIYRHTYRPEYSCCEENVVCHENLGSCCNFR